MNIFETVEPFDARTHRQAATHTDTEDAEHGSIVRKWGVEPIPSGEVKATRKAKATDLRWQKETAGIVIAGVPVATDDRSKTLILGKRAKRGVARPDRRRPGCRDNTPTPIAWLCGLGRLVAPAAFMHLVGLRIDVRVGSGIGELCTLQAIVLAPLPKREPT